MGQEHQVLIKRAYDDPSASDGYRVLVDRLWPRGISKDEATIDEWIKDVAPSTELRRWFGHDPSKFDEFADRYRAELEGSAALAKLRALHQEHAVLTLIYSAKDTRHNQAVVLRDLLT